MLLIMTKKGRKESTHTRTPCLETCKTSSDSTRALEQTRVNPVLRKQGRAVLADLLPVALLQSKQSSVLNSIPHRTATKRRHLVRTTTLMKDHKAPFGVAGPMH